MDLKYPYTDFHELNLDWFLAEFKKLTADWLQLQHDWEDQQQAFQDLHDYVQDYFANLNLYQEVHDILYSPEMQQTIQLMLSNITASLLPTVVANQIASVVAAQLAPVVAAQLPNLLNSMIPSFLPDAVAGEAAAWLADHVDPDTGYVIDDTLRIQLAAADAKATGDRCNELEKKIDTISENMKNLLPFQKTSFTGSYGVTVDYDNGVISYSGTASATTTERILSLKTFTLPAGTYKFFASPSTSSLTLKKVSDDSIVVTCGNSVTLATDTEVYMTFTIINGTTYNNTYNIMVVEGQYNVIWEPVTLTAVDQIARKALTDIDEISENYINKMPIGTYDHSYVYGVYFDYTDGIFTLNGTGTATSSAALTIMPEIVLPAGTYRFFSSESTQAFSLLDSNNTLISTINNLSNSVFTLNAETRLHLTGLVVNGQTYSNVTYHVEIKKGDTSEAWTAPTLSAIDKTLRDEVENVIHNGLTGKKWTVCGDSFTAGDFTGLSPSDYTLQDGMYKGKYTVYPYFIGNRTHCIINNVALSGMRLADKGDASDATYSFVTNYQSLIDTTSDYLTLWFGINDKVNNIPIGTINDNVTTTFYGAWNTVLTYIRNNMPNAHVGIVITNGIGSAQTTYNNATRAVAKKFGYQTLDIPKDTSLPLLLWCEEREDLDPAVKTIVDDAFKVSANNAHPNPACHEFESHFIEAWLLRL